MPLGSANRITLSLVFLAAFSALGLWIERHHSTMLVLSVFTAFFCYFWLARTAHPWNFWLGVGARALLFLGLPILSDDIYRFIWDGRLLAEDLSPFSHLPSFYAENGFPASLDQTLFEKLNSPNYFTIYPPLNQFLFWLSAKWGGTSLLTSTNVIRVVLLSADIGSYFILKKLLKHRRLHPGKAHWYFLNPLIIIEGVGNLHFEGLLVFFLLTGVYFFLVNRPLISGLMIGLSIATKLLPLIYLPALLVKIHWRRGLLVTSSAFVVGLVSFLPLYNSELLASMQTSLSLYFQSFEFNASIYFLVREIGFWIKGYNLITTIGPALSLVTFIGIMALAFAGRSRNWSIEVILLLSLSLYLAFATTVHPWYIIPLVALSISTRLWFPIVWSLMIFVSYLGYTSDGFELSMYWVVLEYAVVFTFLVIEIFQRKHENHPQSQPD